MNYTLLKREGLSGAKATVYSVQLEDGTDLFDRFLSENETNFPQDVSNILQRLRAMATKTGAQQHFFKQREGKPGDGVCALFDTPGKHLRLYVIRMGNAVLILGGGGPKKTRTLQQDPKLNYENYTLREVSQFISEKMRTNELQFSDDETELTGNIVQHERTDE